MKTPEWLPYAAAGAALGSVGILIWHNKEAKRIASAQKCFMQYFATLFSNPNLNANSLRYNLIPMAVLTKCGFTSAETMAIRAGTSLLVPPQASWSTLGYGPAPGTPYAKDFASAWVALVGLLAA
jgi:hypothetical protein